MCHQFQSEASLHRDNRFVFFLGAVSYQSLLTQFQLYVSFWSVIICPVSAVMSIPRVSITAAVTQTERDETGMFIIQCQSSNKRQCISHLSRDVYHKYRHSVSNQPHHIHFTCFRVTIRYCFSDSRLNLHIAVLNYISRFL